MQKKKLAFRYIEWAKNSPEKKTSILKKNLNKKDDDSIKRNKKISNERKKKTEEKYSIRTLL